MKIVCQATSEGLGPELSSPFLLKMFYQKQFDFGECQERRKDNGAARLGILVFILMEPQSTKMFVIAQVTDTDTHKRTS